MYQGEDNAMYPRQRLFIHPSKMSWSDYDPWARPSNVIGCALVSLCRMLHRDFREFPLHALW
jgi:hypothetical protein